MQSRFVVIDDARLHYKDEGRGSPILLIHGSLGDLADWDGWVTVLSKRHRVVRLDLPGFGLSGVIANGNYSIDRSLSLIDGLMDSLGIERFAIAGVSYGGPIAFRYAATRVERVAARIPPGLVERKLDIANVIGRDREGAIMIGQYVTLAVVRHGRSVGRCAEECTRRTQGHAGQGRP